MRSILSFLIPIKKGKIMFESYPDYSDNARAFSDYLLEFTNYKIIWSVRDVKKYKNTDRIRFVEKDGGHSVLGKLKFIYDSVSSQFLFSTHGSFYYANRRNKYVVLWHGMPLKKIARLQDNHYHSYLDNASYILTTSKYYIPIFQQCFGKQREEILPLGIPRNDFLFHENKSLEVLGIKKHTGEKMIVYLPTFRTANGDARSDSKENVFDSVLDITTRESRAKLNVFLKKLSVIMVVKPHPSDVVVLDEHRLSNLVIIPHGVFADKDVQLNHLLHYADALLTDYSGVFIDYLNLDRPIGFVLTDIAAYNKNRGFLFDNPLDYLPGMQIFTKYDFEKFCDDVSKGYDGFKAVREKLRSIYNDYSDDNNCKRLANYLCL